MFVEQLTTPHPEVAEAGIAEEPILESVRLRTIGAILGTSTRTYDDMVEAAYSTANLVRQSLRFGVHMARHDPLSPESLKVSRTTNCHGHSIVASECLSGLGIPHWVGFANQHSFLLMQDVNSGRVNLIDTAVQQLYVDITPAFIGKALVQQPNPATLTNSLRGDIVLARSLFLDKDTALRERPWMSFSSGKEHNYRFKTEAECLAAHTLVLRSYPPEIGREVLHAYANFTHAMHQGNTQTAHSRLQELDGLYPDIDRRNRLRQPTSLISRLGHHALVDEAMADIAAVERSLSMTSDLWLRLWPVDQQRKLGTITKSSSLIAAAIQAYDEIRQHRKDTGLSTGLVEGRIRRAQSQREQIAASSKHTPTASLRGTTARGL